MQPFRLDPASPVPASVQLAAQIRYQVLAGLVPPGARLPSVRDLAATHGLNRNTVAKVMSELAAEGIISGHQGRGFFATTATGHSATALRQLIAATARQGESLGVAAPALALSLLAHGGLTEPQGRPAARVLLVGVSRTAVLRLKTALETSLSVAVEAMLTDELADRGRHGPGERWDLVTATLFASVEARAVGGGARPLVLAPDAAQAAWQTVQSLPTGTPLLATAGDWVEAGRIRRALSAAGLTRLDLQVAAGSAAELAPALQRAAWAVAPGHAARLLQEAGAGERPRLLLEPAELTPALLERVRRTLSAAPRSEQRAAPSPWF